MQHISQNYSYFISQSLKSFNTLFILRIIAICLLEATISTQVTAATLPEIVVTPTRQAQTVDESLATVTVITREQLERSQAVTLPDVLRTVVGVDSVSNGSLGKVTSVFMRGTEADHVLVLIDGVKIGSPTLGVVSFQDLPVNQIERIEVVRGPRSSLYGSEAIGGVIQIFTRQGEAADRLEMSGGLGSHQTYQLQTRLAGTAATHWYNVQANYLQSQGFNSCAGSWQGGCFTVEPDDDGYDNTSFNVSFGQRVGRLNVTAQALRIQGHNEFDSAFNNETDFTQQVLGLTADMIVNDRWQTNWHLGNLRDKLNNFGQAPATTFDTQRTTLSWQNNLWLSPGHTLILGYDYQRDTVDDSTVAYTTTHRNNQGLFAEYQIKQDHFDILGGWRYDDNEQFGSYHTGNLALGYALTPTLRLVTAYGTAFKAPTFNELYYPGAEGFPAFGNPALQPEESHTVEIGLTSHHDDYTWSINGYRTHIDDLISGFPATNLETATIVGLESTVNWRLTDWDLMSTLAWLRPENAKTGQLLPRRAEKTLNIDLSRSLGSWRVGGHILMQSHRFEEVANTQRLGGYVTVDIRGEYRFSKQWQIRARLDNVLDKEYQTALFYHSAGRSVFLSLHYQR